MDEKKYKGEIKKYHLIYKDLNSVNCPTLNGEQIIFNRHGFNHLIRKGKRLRTRKETITRLGLLRYVVRVISSSKSSLIKRIEFNGKDSIVFFGLSLKINLDLNVRVVIRKVNNGPMHFYSIMLKN